MFLEAVREGGWTFFLCAPDPTHPPLPLSRTSQIEKNQTKRTNKQTNSQADPSLTPRTPPHAYKSRSPHPESFRVVNRAGTVLTKRVLSSDALTRMSLSQPGKLELDSSSVPKSGDPGNQDWLRAQEWTPQPTSPSHVLRNELPLGRPPGLGLGSRRAG